MRHLLCVAVGVVLFSGVLACSGDEKRRTTPDTQDGDVSSGGRTGSGGRAGTGGASGGTTASGGRSSVESGVGGSNDSGGSGPGVPDASVDGGPTDGSTPETDASFGEPTVVTSYGCFILSGDGEDLLPSGEAATIVTNPVYSSPCGGSSWVSDNADGYAPEQTPTTLRLHRAFTLGPDVADGDVTISFKADDAIDFVLNDVHFGSCTPVSASNQCQASCTAASLPGDSVKRDGSTNRLEIQLINIQSVPAPNGNFGYTAVSYAICIQPPV